MTVSEIQAEIALLDARMSMQRQSGTSRYAIGDRSFEYVPLKELRAEKTALQAELQAALAVAAGYGPGIRMQYPGFCR